MVSWNRVFVIVFSSLRVCLQHCFDMVVEIQNRRSYGVRGCDGCGLGVDLGVPNVQERGSAIADYSFIWYAI